MAPFNIIDHIGCFGLHAVERRHSLIIDTCIRLAWDWVDIYRTAGALCWHIWSFGHSSVEKKILIF